MHTDVESGGTSVFDRRRPVFLDQGKHSQDAANTGLCLLLIDQLTELADPGSGVFAPSQELCCTQRHFLGAVLVRVAISTASLVQVLTKKLVGVGMQSAPVSLIPLHLHCPPDPSLRQAVVGRLDLHETVQMHGACA